MTALLEGQVSMITGGARGQGRAHAVTCARNGADVVIVDHTTQMATAEYATATSQDLAETARLVEVEGRRSVVIDADVRNQAALDAAVQQAITTFGHIDHLIANAGILSHGRFWEIDDRQWEEMIGVNLTGVWRASRAVAPHMTQRERGSIVVISSMNGLEAGSGTAHYTAAKHGLIGLMKAMALELAPYGVRCNAICPGAIDTPMTNHQDAWDRFAGHPGGTREDMLAGGHKYHALRGTTFLSPQVIADAALYLNSHLASAVTGAVLPVDAGHLLLTGLNQAPVTEDARLSSD